MLVDNDMFMYGLFNLPQYGIYDSLTFYYNACMFFSIIITWLIKIHFVIDALCYVLFEI